MHWNCQVLTRHKRHAFRRALEFAVVLENELIYYLGQVGMKI